MKMYFDHMHSYHISYAANPGTEKAYIRGRRYMPERQGLKGTALNPDYFTPKLFATGVKHHITVIKKDRDLHMRVENPDQVVYCHMPNPDLPAITEGRIGLRHMFTRSARYANFRVSRPVPGGDAGAEPNIGKLRSELRARSAESASFLSAAEPASGPIPVSEKIASSSSPTKVNGLKSMPPPSISDRTKSTTVPSCNPIGTVQWQPSSLGMRSAPSISTGNDRA